MPADPLPGDELLPDAGVTFDRARRLAAPPEAIWPWLLQLGRRRAGWYLPARAERVIPASSRAARTIVAEWQQLAVGDRVPDYGGRDATLTVAALDPPHALVYRSERGSAAFTWALVLRPLGADETELRLRFRGRFRHRSGWRHRALTASGDLFDWATAELMLAGLAERLAATYQGAGS